MVLKTALCMALMMELLPDAARAQARVLTTAGEVFRLPGEEAAKALPVHLTVTVTYYQATRWTLFVADKTGGVYVNLSSPDALPIHRGDLIEVYGETAKDYHTMVTNPHFRILGRGTLPESKTAGFRELISGADDCQYVTIRGMVRSASMKKDPGGKMVQLEIQVPGGLVRAYIEDGTGVDLSGLIDAEVEFGGVAGGIFTKRRQLMQTVLYATDRSEMKVLKTPRVKPTDLSWTAIDDVLQTRYVEDRSERVRVRGAVTFYEPANSIVIQHNGESLLAQTHDVRAIALGEIVDVVGFADANGSGPMLDGAEIFQTGRFERVTPQPVSYDEAISGKYNDGLVTLDGKVLSQLHSEISDTMVITVDEHPVNVLLWTGDRPQMRQLPQGTTVKVTGICHITKTDPWGNSVSFLLEMRETGDVSVVANASWWTVTRLLLLLIGLLAVSLSITGWAMGLRRRVSRQAERIQQSMAIERQRSRLLEEINSATPLHLLLEDICHSIAGLVADVRCTYELAGYEYEDNQLKGKGAADDSLPAGQGDERRTPLFESVMTDTTGVTLGVFRVISTAERTLSIEEREALTVGASLSNLALNQRRLYEQLNFTSTHDALTGLPNRRYSDMKLAAALAEASASGERVGVVYIDVDHFKTVNDKFGHKTGDLYLQEISLRLSAAVRERDLLARIGGDEFLLTVPGIVGLEDALTYKQGLQSCFHESFLLDGITIHGSASMGMALCPDHGVTAEELQRHADTEMYSEKRGERRPVFVEPMIELLVEQRKSS